MTALDSPPRTGRFLMSEGGGMRNKLTAKQAAFVLEYAVDRNATQAAIRAGYSRKTANRIASENLSKPVIANAIAETLSQAAAAIEMNIEYALERLKLEIEREGEGASHSARVQAITLLTRYTGGFTERTEIGVTERGSDAKRELSERLARQLAATRTTHTHEPN